jgi:cytochrome c556
MTHHHHRPGRFRKGGGPRNKWFSTTAGAYLAVAWSILIATMAAPGAQRTRPDNDSQGAPVATNRIAQNPDAYYGKLVTVSAGVEQILSKTAFLVDQQRKVVGSMDVQAVGKPVLVIAPYLIGRLDQKSYLWVRGELVKFDATAIARVAPDYKIDLPSEVVARYQGQPVLLANSVMDSTHAELGKKPYPPPSAEELSLRVAMKTIGPAFAELQAAAKDSKGEVVSANAAKLLPAFSQTEEIWEDLGQIAASEWARTARDHADAIARAAASGSWDSVKTSAVALNRLCQNCHGAYRDRQEDGAFRIRPGSF